MNGFEERVVNEIDNMTNIGLQNKLFYQSLPRFYYSNKSGETIVLETKGDYLDAESKIRLGGLWANKAGNDYHYFIVYERGTVDRAYKLENFWV